MSLYTKEPLVKFPPETTAPVLICTLFFIYLFMFPIRLLKKSLVRLQERFELLLYSGELPCRPGIKLKIVS